MATFQQGIGGEAVVSRKAQKRRAVRGPTLENDRQVRLFRDRLMRIGEGWGLNPYDLALIFDVSVPQIYRRLAMAQEAEAELRRRVS